MQKTNLTGEVVNPTNPNALENQPGGNGNGASTLTSQGQPTQDSNGVQGDPKNVAPSVVSGSSDVPENTGKETSSKKGSGKTS